MPLFATLTFALSVSLVMPTLLAQPPNRRYEATETDPRQGLKKELSSLISVSDAAFRAIETHFRTKSRQTVERMKTLKQYLSQNPGDVNARLEFASLEQTSRLDKRDAHTQFSGVYHRLASEIAAFVDGLTRTIEPLSPEKLERLYSMTLAQVDEALKKAQSCAEDETLSQYGRENCSVQISGLEATIAGIQEKWAKASLMAKEASNLKEGLAVQHKDAEAARDYHEREAVRLGAEVKIAEPHLDLLNAHRIAQEAGAAFSQILRRPFPSSRQPREQPTTDIEVPSTIKKGEEFGPIRPVNPGVGNP